MINPEDPRLISLNTERRVTPSDIATNQPFKSNYHLDNSTLVFKHPADTEGGGKEKKNLGQKCICACVDVCLCMFVCVLRPRGLHWREKCMNKTTGRKEHNGGPRLVRLWFPREKGM